MDLDNLRDLVRLFEASALAEIEIEEEGRRIRLKKPQHEFVYTAPHPAAGHPMAPALAPPHPAEVRPAEAGVEIAGDSPLAAIKSPMVGTFYAAPAPEDPPYVSAGDTVEEGQVVCIVEAMKLKNEVTAPFAAVIEETLVENGEPVEYSQPLFVVRPLA